MHAFGIEHFLFLYWACHSVMLTWDCHIKMLSSMNPRSSFVPVHALSHYPKSISASYCDKIWAPTMCRHCSPHHTYRWQMLIYHMVLGSSNKLFVCGHVGETEGRLGVAHLEKSAFICTFTVGAFWKVELKHSNNKSLKNVPCSTSVTQRKALSPV